MDLSNSKSKEVKADPEEILQKVNLSEITHWDPAKQHEACNLIHQYACIFSPNDLDFGKTSIVKHLIKLTDSTPFMECYQCIPVGMYGEVKRHISKKCLI